MQKDLSAAVLDCTKSRLLALLLLGFCSSCDRSVLSLASGKKLPAMLSYSDNFWHLFGSFLPWSDSG